MRRAILILSLFIISIIGVHATEQIPDLLVIGNETFYLKTFTLEQLRIKYKIKVSPFNYGDYQFFSTTCYRGYVATWKVIDDKLMLIEIDKVDSIREKLDIAEYFKKANYEPIIMILIA